MGNKVVLACADCLSRNYSTDKNKLSDHRLEARKYCKQCGQHTLHRETK